MSHHRAGVFSCANANTTCSGATQTAQYKVTGTNNQVVTVNAPDVTLPTRMTCFDVGSAGSALARSASGTPALRATFDLKRSDHRRVSDPDGTYFRTFNVTVNY